MNRSSCIGLALVLLIGSTSTVPAATRLIGITGNTNSGEGGFDPNDQKLFEIDLTSFSLNPLVQLAIVPDTTSIGFNPDNGLLYRVAGSSAYRDVPTRIGYNDNQFMETVNVNAAGYPQVGIFNANPQGDGTHGPYGLPAPRPNFVLPAERRTDEQTDPSFRQDGPNEYHAMRDITWSSDEKLFYGADERGIFKLTPTGESTFIGHPGGLQPKGISFFTVNGMRQLLLSERDGPTLNTIDPMTGQIMGNPVVMLDQFQQPLQGVLSLVESPDGSELLGIAKADPIRQLIRINPLTGATTVLGDLDVGNAKMSDLAFVIDVGPVLHTWNVDANGNWSTGANWTNGEPNGASVAANFLGAITAPRTVTVDGAKTVGNITFDNVQSYTIAGPGPLQIDNGGAATIQVLSGSHTISAPISFAAGTTVTKSGPGTLTLSGTQTHGAGSTLIASEGVTNLNSDGGQNLAVQANAATNFGSTQHLGALNVGAGATATLTAGGPKNLVTNALTVAGGSTPTGKLDVTNNAAIVDYPTAGPSPAATIRSQIIAGRGGSGLGKPWNGLGITSSTAQADVVTSPNSTSVGYAVNGDLPLGAYTDFRGQPVDPSSVLIRYTRTADANLDGLVNDNDVTIVGANYAPGIPKAAWSLGDFDYNGFVDDNDVTLLGVFYNPGATAIPAPAPIADSAASGGGAVAAVPEPTSVALTIIGAACLLVCLLAHIAYRARTSLTCVSEE